MSYPAEQLYPQAQTLEEMRKAAEQQDADSIATGEAFLQMTATPGWKVLEAHLHSQIEGCKEKLVDENNEEASRLLKMSVRVHSNVLGYVQTMILEAQRLQEQNTNPSSEG